MAVQEKYRYIEDQEGNKTLPDSMSGVLEVKTREEMPDGLIEFSLRLDSGVKLFLPSEANLLIASIQEGDIVSLIPYEFESDNGMKIDKSSMHVNIQRAGKRVVSFGIAKDYIVLD